MSNTYISVHRAQRIEMVRDSVEGSDEIDYHLITLRVYLDGSLTEIKIFSDDKLNIKEVKE